MNFKLPRWLSRESLELLCPSTCTLCHKAIEQYEDRLCQACWAKFQRALEPLSCPTCGHNVGDYAVIDDRCHRCQKRRPVVSRVVRVGQFTGILREFIHAIKYENQSHLDRFLGQLLAAAMMGDKNLNDVDVLIPIPLHWRRRWKRHYNQADLIARETHRSLKQQGHKVAIRRDLLRVRHTIEQTTLVTSERMRNLHGAFAVRPDADFSGKHICLIDDVTTTGTTLRVAANALKQTNPARISAAVLAVAGND